MSTSRLTTGIGGTVRPRPLDAYVHVALALWKVGYLVYAIDQLGRDGLSLQLVGDTKNGLHTQPANHLRLNPAQRLATR
jgi:hypothetical protein